MAAERPYFYILVILMISSAHGGTRGGYGCNTCNSGGGGSQAGLEKIMCQKTQLLILLSLLTYVMISPNPESRPIMQVEM